MRKTAFQLMRDIGFEIGLVQDPSITSFTDSGLRLQLLDLLNRAKSSVCSEVNLDTLMDITTIGTIAQYTTGTVSITQNTTTVTGSGTTFTAAMVGRKIQIGSFYVSYKIVKVSSSTSLEIDQPFVNATVSGVAYTIYQDTFSLPPFVNKISSIRQTNYRWTLTRRTIQWIDTRWPNPLFTTGRPLDWALIGEKFTRDPLGTTVYTADASTSSTQIVDSALPGGVEDYYKGWTVYNVTRAATATVASYAQSSKTITLESPITGQVVTDTYWLGKRELQIVIRPTPTDVQPLTITYYKPFTPFFNDTDFEKDIDENNEDVLFYKAVALYYAPRDNNRASYYEGMATSRINRIKEYNNDAEVSKYAFGINIDNYKDQAWDNSYLRRGW